MPDLVTANQGEAGITELCEHLLERGVGIEAVLTGAGLQLEQVHHGDGVASWAVSKRALARRHGIRTGLEDTTVLPNGDQAADNAELVRTAAEWIAVGPS